MPATRHALPLALSLVCGLAAALPAGTAHADPDSYKLRDRQPPFMGKGFTGGSRLGVPGVASIGEEFARSNVVLHSWLSLPDLPKPPPGTRTQLDASDIWGYTSPSGREYAIIGMFWGTAFVEVTNPDAPVIVGYIDSVTFGSQWHDQAVIGPYAYLVSEGGLGIQVVDMTQIDSGVVTLVQNKTQNGHTSTHTILANPDSGYLYLCGANISNGGLVVVDAKTDPTNPTITGAWTGRYVHEAQIVTYTSGPYAGREIAYCFTGGAGIDVIDVTNKTNPVRIGGASYSGARYCHQGWLTPDKRYLYVNDELDEGASVVTTTTRVFDVTNPAAPALVRTFSNGNTAIDHNLYIKGNLLFEGNYRSGLRVFDISTPLTPVEVAWIDTYPQGDGAFFNGVWGNYPFFASGTVVLSDIERGLFVVTIDLDRLDVAIDGAAPTRLDPGVNTPVVATVSELGRDVNPNSVTLHSRVDAGPVTQTPMTLLNGAYYRGNIPAASCGQTVEYWVTAQSTLAETFSFPANAPASVLTARVYSGLEATFADNFQTDLGWTVANAGLSDGAWQRGVPVGGSTSAPSADADGSGQCYLTANRTGNSDVDNGSTTLTSPAFDATVPGATLKYSVWHYDSNTSTPDTLLVEISTNNGGSWQTLETVAPVSSSPAWQTRSFNLASVITPTSQVRVRFTSRDLGAQSIVESGVDNVRVEAEFCDEPAPCPADANNDGTLDAFDFNAFVDAFNAQNLALADQNQDTTLDAFDFNAFVDAFNAGCPE